MDITLEKIADLLKNNDNFYILTHQYPDGDTLGSAFSLCKVLQKLCKRALVLNDDDIPKKYSFLSNGIKKEYFEPGFIICVDVADVSLLGSNLSKKFNKFDLCIDHHKINKNFSEYRYVDPLASSTTQIIYDLLKIMNVDMDPLIANSIYTGLATDTGCFKYKNTTPKTHEAAAKMIELGADFYYINRLMFDLKTKEQFIVERYILDSIEFYCDDRLAAIYVTLDMLKKSGADDSFVDGIAGIPKQIEGVLVGVTFRQKEGGLFKISVRTEGNLDASSLCTYFGGGGHQNAAGCTLKGTLENVKKEFLEYTREFLRKNI